MLERQDRLRQDGDLNPEANLMAYNVFVLTATLPEMLESLPHLIARYEDIDYKHPAHDAPVTLKANSTNFAHREKDEMRDLTKVTEIFSTSPLPDNLVASSPSTHWDPVIGQVYLGNASDVPIADEWVPSLTRITRGRSVQQCLQCPRSGRWLRHLHRVPRLCSVPHPRSHACRRRTPFCPRCRLGDPTLEAVGRRRRIARSTASECQLDRSFDVPKFSTSQRSDDQRPGVIYRVFGQMVEDAW
jgi:hypothetical protein